jgi:ATP-grasp domain
MAKVLLVDTNFSSGPIHQELVLMGHEVHVVGNNPGDCLAKVSPSYWQLDYADVDALKALIDREKFAFLVPGCTDRSYLSCVEAGQRRFPGLDRPNACEAIFNKRSFRRLAEKLELPAPERLPTDRLPIRWPVIVKPVDAFSGKGITVLRENNVHAFEQAVAAARAVSPSGEYLIEAFIEGQLYSHSAFICGGHVVQDFLVQEDSTINPFVVDTSRVVDAPTGMQARVRACTESMAAELGLADGLLHTQLISQGKDIYLIETTRRCPGDLYSQLIELSTGYPYARSYVLPFLGQSVGDAAGEIRHKHIMRHTVTLNASQSFAYLSFKSAVHIERWTPLSLVGDQLKPSPQGRVGVLFCRATNEQELECLYQTTLRRDLYEVCA